jgi:hypothetical protein
MRFLHTFRERLRWDEDFRLNVSYLIVMPLYVGLIVTIFWWGITSGG